MAYGGIMVEIHAHWMYGPQSTRNFTIEMCFILMRVNKMIRRQMFS